MNLQPLILANTNVDLAQVEKVWAGYFNDSWNGRINEKLDEGFIIIRIQTELETVTHATKIYMVKLKGTASVGAPTT